jgi:hypothetical protein
MQTTGVEVKLGGAYTSRSSTPWVSRTGQLKIKTANDSIAFYENGIMLYAEPFMLSSNDCYIYAYTSSQEGYTGTDAFDNFALTPASMFSDGFKDKNYNGWTVDAGNWTAQNGRLESSTFESYIHCDTEFSANRYVTANVQTLTSHYDPWSVLWLTVKAIDGNNYVYALIRTDGIVELSMYLNGQKTMYQVGSNLSPFDPHVISVSTIGDNGKVWVDGTLYINNAFPGLSSLSGKVALNCFQSTVACTKIAVFDE